MASTADGAGKVDAQADVAVVIPCFNAGTYLYEAVDSVLAQSLPAAEVVIVNDGSDDLVTLAALKGYENAGLTVIHTPNRGAPAARNLGISQTKSPFVLCFDADDILLPTFMEQTLAEIQKSERIGVVATWVELFGEKEVIWRPRPSCHAALLWQNQIPSQSLFRRACWEEAGGYGDLKGCQDWDLWLSIIVERKWDWQVVPQVLVRYRQHPGSISEYREGHRQEILRELFARHRDAYVQHVEELFIVADTEFQELRRTQ